MSISNYGELKTAVANWLQRADLTARVPEFIALGEARLYTDLRVREMETTDDITVTTGQRTSPLPTRYVELEFIYIDGSPIQRLEFRNKEEYWSVFGNLPSAKPRTFMIEGESFYWGPVPDAGYTAKVCFYQRQVAFNGDADTNAIIARWPNLYLYPSLLESAPFLDNDPRIVTWAAMYETLLERVHESDRRDRASGDTIPPGRAVHAA